MKIISLNHLEYCVWSFTPMHETPPLLPNSRVFPLCLMCWTTNRVLLGGAAAHVSHDRRRSESAHALRTKPREGLCCTSHTASIRSAEANWVTEQCSGNITKVAAQLLSLSVCPPHPHFIFPSHYLYWCALRFPPSLTTAPLPLMRHSQLSVLPKSNSCCGLR